MTIHVNQQSAAPIAKSCSVAKPKCSAVISSMFVSSKTKFRSTFQRWGTSKRSSSLDLSMLFLFTKRILSNCFAPWEILYPKRSWDGIPIRDRKTHVVLNVSTVVWNGNDTIFHGRLLGVDLLWLSQVIRMTIVSRTKRGTYTTIHQARL